MPQSRITKTALAVVIVLSGALAALHQRQEAGAAAPAAEETAAAALPRGENERADLIRRVYDAYAARSAAAGAEVDFTLDDFRTVGGESFDEVALFPDLVTPSGGWELAAVIDVRIEGGAPGREIRFRPEWRQVENPPDESLLGRPASEAVGPGASHLYNRTHVEALTSYRVRVVHDGLERTYRAAAMWLHAKDGTPAFGLADNVVPDVALAVDDGEGPGSLLGNQHTVLDPTRERRELAAGRCEAGESVARVGQPGSVLNAVFPPPPRDAQGSYVGVHACSCAADCSARCEATTEATYDGCRASLAASESDVRQRAVAVTYSVDQSTPPGLPAACRTGLSCELQDCLDGLCGSALVRLEPGPDGQRLDTVAGSAAGRSSYYDHACGECDPAI